MLSYIELVNLWLFLLHFLLILLFLLFFILKIEILSIFELHFFLPLKPCLLLLDFLLFFGDLLRNVSTIEQFLWFSHFLTIADHAPVILACLFQHLLSLLSCYIPLGILECHLCSKFFLLFYPFIPVLSFPFICDFFVHASNTDIRLLLLEKRWCERLIVCPILHLRRTVITRMKWKGHWRLSKVFIACLVKLSISGFHIFIGGNIN